MPIDQKTLERSKRTRQTDAVLRHLASSNGSLYYEVEMLNEAAKRAITSPPGFDQKVVIECFLVHFRILRDFFYPPSNCWTDDRRLDDVIAFDFSENWSFVQADWEECSPNERDRINKLLAHISYSRTNLDHGWPIYKMVSALCVAMSQFIGRLPNERREWFEALKGKYAGKAFCLLGPPMSTTLDQILSAVRARVALAKRALPLREMAELAKERARPTRGFREKLLAAAKQDGFAIIAELKKASPSRGVLRGTFHVGGLAMQLERAGASALSVLTEEQFFAGSLDYLREASAASNLPCLRKDFIIDEYQLHEARANSADAILLIAAALSDAELHMLHSKARELGLDALCEVHNEDELARVAAIGADIVGVNSRDLRTLQVDMTTHARLAPQMPKNALRIAESGISHGKEIGELSRQGYQAFLVGELLMKSDDPGPVLAKLIAEAKAAP